MEEIKDLSSDVNETIESPQIEQPTQETVAPIEKEEPMTLPTEPLVPNDLPAAKDEPVIMVKSFYESKTLWVNIIIIIAIIVQSATGKNIIDPNAQAAFLCVINVILRLVTKKEIVW